MAIREVAVISPTDIRIGAHTTVAGLASEVERQLYRQAKTLSLCAEWIEHRYKSVSASYSMVDETVILADASSAAVTVTLPLSNVETVNRDVHVKRLNAGVNNVTIAANGTDTIDGAATVVLVTQYESRHLISDGLGHWWLL